MVADSVDGHGADTTHGSGDLPDALLRQLEPLHRQLHGTTPNAVVPLLGSGLSRGPKTWSGLLQDLAGLLPDSKKQSVLLNVKKGHLIEAAGYLESEPAVGIARVHDAIEAAFGRSIYMAMQISPKRAF